MSGAVLLNPPKPRAGVMIGMVHGKLIESDFMDCLIHLIMSEPQIIGRLARRSGVNVSRGRNSIAADFLKTNASHLLMLDSDMTFSPRLVKQLMAHRKHIVGGLCNALVDGEPVPVLKRLDDEGRLVNTEPTSGLMKVASTGGACLLVHHSVFEAIPEPEIGFRWFGEEFTTDGDYLSEDTTFCLRAAAAGFQTWVDTDLKIGHIKERII